MEFRSHSIYCEYYQGLPHSQLVWKMLPLKSEQSQKTVESYIYPGQPVKATVVHSTAKRLREQLRRALVEAVLHSLLHATVVCTASYYIDMLKLVTNYRYLLTTYLMYYRHSSIYAGNVGTQKKNRGSKHCVNRGYLVVVKGRKIEIENRGNQGMLVQN